MLTRTVADTAALLDVLAGYEPGDADLGAAAAGPYAELAGRRPGAAADRRWRSTRRSTGRRSTRRASAAARDAAALLESLGHEVEEITPPWSGLDLLTDFTARVRAADLADHAGSAAGSPAASRPRTTSSR